MRGPNAAAFWGAVIGGVLSIGSAVAQEVTPTPSDSPNVDRRACSVEQLDNCLDGVGGGVTSLDTLRINAAVPRTRDTEDESERAERLARGVVGGGSSAGEGIGGGYNVWVSGSYSDYESDVLIAPYEANTLNALIGIDRSFGERFIAGLTIGYEDTDSDTFYNGGGQDRNGFSLVPYAAYIINDNFSVDAAFGYAWLDTDENRIAPNNGARLLGQYDSDRYFFTANLNYVRASGNWVFGSRAGLIHTKETQDAYTETGNSTQVRSVRERTVDLTQAYLGVDVGYGFGSFEPYAMAIYRNDMSRDDGNTAGGLPGGVVTQPDDNDEFQLGLGLRYFGRSGVSANLEWLRTQGRKDFNDDTVTFSLRVPL